MHARAYLAIHRVVFATLTLTAVLVQFLNGLGKTAFSPVSFFSFFTIESNIFASVVFFTAALLPASRTDSGTFAMIRGAAVLYMVTTGIVYALLLSGLEESLQTPLPWVNLVLHYIMPVVVALDWGIDPPRARISFPRALVWLAFPLLYLGYSLVRGRLVGWYPYPFLNRKVRGDTEESHSTPSRSTST